MMETFACGFCQHIFTANLEQQTLKVADSQLPITWQWIGQKWQGVHRKNELSWSYGIAAIVFVSLPTLIVAMSSYLFPPLSDSRLSWLPLTWVFMTLLAHLACIGWLGLEYYQFPLGLYLANLSRRILLRGEGTR